MFLLLNDLKSLIHTTYKIANNLLIGRVVTDHVMNSLNYGSYIISMIHFLFIFNTFMPTRTFNFKRFFSVGVV